MASNAIVIRGAREHNLRDIDVSIPRNELVVITGLSGSGKSSLAFDTVYAEGQRRYVESLSSYARQFLGQMDKPDLDSIDGLSPAVSIDQKTTSKNPRSTVGTVTEIYDYLRLLFARVGTPHCPECGRVIERQTTDQVVDKVIEAADGHRAYVLAPVVLGRKGEFAKLFADLLREGFSRVRVDGEVTELEEGIKLDKKYKHTIEVVVDRVVVRPSSRSRIAEAVEQACRIASDKVGVYVLPPRDAGQDASGQLFQYSLALSCPVHGHSIDDLQPRDFSFNAPYGACPDCDGLGMRRVVDAEALVEDPGAAVDDGVFGSFFGRSNYYPQIFRAVVSHFGVDPATPWRDLPPRVRRALLDGLGSTKVRVDYHTRDGRDTHWLTTFSGVRSVLFEKYNDTSNDKVKARLEKYIREEPCSTCGGARLKPEFLAVTVGGKSIWDVCSMSCRDSLAFFESLELSERQEFIGGRVVREIVERLRFLVDVGLDYLTLARASATLSGGEAQRIRLATQIGAGLMGVLYILDEPSIGLHQRDNDRLIHTLERLRDQGNTVIVVEHDEDTIRAADYVVDMGPGAGELGGEVVCAGTPAEVMACPDSLTGAYLSGRRVIGLPRERRRPDRGALTITGARHHNLKDVTCSIEFGTLTVVTGVSGSGTSSLVTDTLAPALTNAVQRSQRPVGEYDALEGVERARRPRSWPVLTPSRAPTCRDAASSGGRASAAGPTAAPSPSPALDSTTSKTSRAPSSSARAPWSRACQGRARAPLSPTRWRLRSPTPCSAPSARWGSTTRSRAWRTSTRSSTSTRRPSAARRAPTRPPTSASGTTCGRFSPPPPRAACAATRPVASRSTCPAAAARPARATGRSRSR